MYFMYNKIYFNIYLYILFDIYFSIYFLSSHIFENVTAAGFPVSGPYTTGQSSGRERQSPVLTVKKIDI